MSSVDDVIMYEYMQGNVTDMVNNCFWFDKVTHGLYIGNADDIQAPHGRLDVCNFNTKLDGPNMFNSIPLNIKNSAYIDFFFK